MKLLNYKVALLYLIVFSVSFFSYSQHTLVKDGKVLTVIVVADKAPEPVKFAGNELAFFLEKISGQKVTVVNTISENKDIVSIILGDCKEAENAGIRVSEIARDGYIIKSVGNKIFIAGKDSSGETADIKRKLDEVAKASYMQQRILMASDNWAFERGTLYGTYRFLEELGVRWFFPGEKGTSVPVSKNIILKDINLKEEPYFLSRQIGESYTKPINLKSSKITYNKEEIEALEYTPENNILWALRQKSSSFVIPLNHMSPRTAWDERFGKDHPEYFALLENGKRDVDISNPEYRSHLCYSNSDVTRTVVEDIQAYRRGDNADLRGIPQQFTDRRPFNKGWDADIFNGNISSVLPNDSFRACYCEECRKLLPGKNTERLVQHSKQVWSFIDKCGRELQKKLPDHKITCLGYQTYSMPYENMPALPDNVIVGLCPGIYKNPYNLVDEINYQKLLEIIKTWRSKSSSPLAYWLHNLYRYRAPQKYAIPMYLPHLLSRLWKDLARNGRWIYVEEEKGDIMFEQLNSYIMMKLSYNPETNIDELLNDYYHKFYGNKAASIMKKVFDDIEKQSIEIGKTNAGRTDVWEKYFTSDVLKNYVMLTDEALKLTAGTPYEENVRLFAKYYLGLMQKGHSEYVRNVKNVLDKKGTSACIAGARGQIKIDGILDEEAWGKPTRTVTMHNNVDGKKTQWPTEVKFMRSHDKLYISFICYDPETMNRTEKEMEADSVEIFLDPEHSHDSYYQIQVNMAGKVTDLFYEGGGEPGQDAWNSNAEVAVKKYKDRWVAEIAIPRSSFNDGLKNPKDRPWGANFCRTVINAPEAKDRFSCWSPILIGRFHQPDMFGHI